MKNKLIMICLSMALLYATVGCSPLIYPFLESAHSSDKDAEHSSQKGDSLLLEGIEKYNEGDYADAIDKLLAAESAGLDKQELSTLYSYMGASCEELTLYDQAIEYYQKAVDENPKDPQNYVNLAIGYRLTGDYETALQIYEQGLEIDPDYPELNSSLGTLYVLLDNPGDAIPYFERALKADSSLAVTYGNAALAYAMVGDFETAEEYLATARLKGYTNADVIQERIDALK